MRLLAVLIDRIWAHKNRPRFCFVCKEPAFEGDFCSEEHELLWVDCMVY